MLLYTKDEQSCGVTYGQMSHAIRQLGTFLLEQAGPAAHVALLGNTGVEWITAYLSCLCYGLVVTPLDKALPQDELYQQFLLSDSVLLLYDSGCEKAAADIAEKASGVVCIPLDKPMLGCETTVSTIMTGDRPATEPPTLDEAELFEIVFTSGTTGRGKGVMLSGSNIAAAVMFGIRTVDMSVDDRLLSFLPNNHTYELTVGILTPMYFGMSIILTPSIRQLKKSIDTFHPTTMLLVPAILDMFRKEILRQVNRAGKAKQFRNALRLARIARAFGLEQRRKLFGEIIDYFGGNLKTLIYGGAFVSKELVNFYRDLGFRLIEGYGITECSPIVACNTDRSTRGLGEISPYCDVKCIDGEICVSGRIVMLGYYKNPEATARAIRDGWFHTGDLGRLDRYNCVWLTGRKDNLIINSNGENISPEMIEDYLTTSELIDSCIVYAEKDLIAASVYPNYPYVEREQINNIESSIRDAVLILNKKLPQKMRVERVHIRTTPFDMTTTMKVKSSNR